MTHEVCFQNFYEKVSGTLITDKADKGYDCLYELVFEFEEV